MINYEFILKYFKNRKFIYCKFVTPCDTRLILNLKFVMHSVTFVCIINYKKKKHKTLDTKETYMKIATRYSSFTQTYKKDERVIQVGKNVYYHL